MITKMSASSMNAKTWYRSMLAGNDAYVDGAYELISTAYGTGSSGTITFSSIPQTYKHLQIRFTARTTDSTWNSFAFNLSSTIGHQISGAPIDQLFSKVTDYPEQFEASMANSGSISDAHKVGIIDVLDYASASKNKTIRAFYGGPTQSGTSGTNSVILRSGFTASTAAITTMTFSGWNGAVFGTTSRFSLYGIKG